jgi:protein MPE1
LKTVDKTTALSGGDGEDSKPPSGVMVNAEGQFVIAEPDKASWEQFQAKTKSSAAAQKAALLGDKELQDRGLECSIDKRIFIDPMKTPCCEKTYCSECITNALIESDLVCPGCHSEGILIDNLKPDEETSLKIKAYLEEKNAAAKQEKERSKSPSVKAETTPPPAVESVKAKSKSPTPEQVTKSHAKSPPSKSASPKAKEPTPPKEVSNPKKRPADELLENPKIPKGPKAMQQQEAQKAAMQQQKQFQQYQQQMMNGMNGFPNAFNNPQNFYGGNNGFNGMPNMMNGFPMGMASPMMMNPMMGMNGFGGFPNMYGAGGFGTMGGIPNMMPNGMNGAANGNGAGAAAGQFPNQQKTIFAEPLPNEEDNAYFRKPVNPHRHQGRQRRARPSDYREL